MQLVRPDPSYPDAKHANEFQRGMEFQDFVCAAFAREHIILQNLVSKKWQYDVGENLQGFEIKLDDPCSNSKRLSIEVAEKSRADPELYWTPSGIMRNDNSWLYIQGNRNILFVFDKKWLRRWYHTKRPAVEEKHGTICTFYLPFDVALTCAAKVFEFPSA